MWMGPVAFRYYVEAAVRYFRSTAAVGDSDGVNSFAGMLGLRNKQECESLRPVATQLADACQYILAHWESFDVMPTVYMGLREKYAKLHQSLGRLAGGP